MTFNMAPTPQLSFNAGQSSLSRSVATALAGNLPEGTWLRQLFEQLRIDWLANQLLRLAPRIRFGSADFVRANCGQRSRVDASCIAHSVAPTAGCDQGSAAGASDGSMSVRTCASTR